MPVDGGKRQGRRAAGGFRRLVQDHSRDHTQVESAHEGSQPPDGCLTGAVTTICTLALLGVVALGFFVSPAGPSARPISNEAQTVAGTEETAEPTPATTPSLSSPTPTPPVNPPMAAMPLPMPPPPMPPPPMPPPMSPSSCRSWCDDNEKPWVTKCQYRACSGCPECYCQPTLGAVAFACTASDISTRLLRAVHKLCSRWSSLRFLLNAYDTSHCPSHVSDSLPSCATLTHVPGMKGLFWKSKLTENVTRPFSFVWLFDSDMVIDEFELGSAQDAMHKARVSAAQPLIWAGPEKRCSDHDELNAVWPMPTGCRAQKVNMIEVMVPIFKQDAWRYVHEHVLGVLPDSFLRRSVNGIDTVWCSMLEHGILGRTACAILSVEIEHLDAHSIEKHGGDAIVRGRLLGAVSSPPALPPPTPPAACEDWCNGHTSNWAQKCVWPTSACSACHTCFVTEVKRHFSSDLMPTRYGRMNCLLSGDRAARRWHPSDMCW